jgi:hypothetical protein
MHKFPLDENKGSIRLLLALPQNGIPRVELLERLKERGVGRTAAYKAIEELKELGLIEDFKMRSTENGKQVLVTKQTNKGTKVEIKIRGILAILQEE